MEVERPSPEPPGRVLTAGVWWKDLEKQKHTNNDKQSVLDTLPLAQTFMYYSEAEKTWKTRQRRRERVIVIGYV